MDITQLAKHEQQNYVSWNKDNKPYWLQVWIIKSTGYKYNKSILAMNMDNKKV